MSLFDRSSTIQLEFGANHSSDVGVDGERSAPSTPPGRHPSASEHMGRGIRVGWTGRCAPRPPHPVAAQLPVHVNSRPCPTRSKNASWRRMTARTHRELLPLADDDRERGHFRHRPPPRVRSIQADQARAGVSAWGGRGAKRPVHPIRSSPRSLPGSPSIPPGHQI
jgi:hypothetical protein